VIVPSHPDRLGVSDSINDFDRRLCFLEPKAAAAEDIAIGFRMQIGKSLTEFDLSPTDADGAERPSSFVRDHGRQVGGIDTKEPANPGPLQGQEAGRLIRPQEMDYALPNPSEDPSQYIEKMIFVATPPDFLASPFQDMAYQ
jgi:hypothetical protein